MAIDIEKYRNQQKQTATDAVKDLREAYAFISLTTNMPYVECEEVDYNDQIHLFARKEDADGEPNSLDQLFDSIEPLSNLNSEITGCILSEACLRLRPPHVPRLRKWWTPSDASACGYVP